MNGSMIHEPLTEEQIDELDGQRERIDAQLAAFRSQIINGFVHHADEVLAGRLCLRRDQIILMLNGEDE